MKRRDFLKFSGLFGLGAVSPIFPSLQLFAAEDNYSGPLWLTIEARGGWDPTSFCDPKGYVNPTDAARLNNYPAANKIRIGNEFEIAPPPDSFIDNTELYSAEQFFTTYASRLLLINGIDVGTNSHADGQRHNWSGELARQGFPNIGALISGVLAKNKALPFVTNGGYSVGANLVTPVRLSGSALNAMLEIAYPNRSTNPRSSTVRSYYPSEVLDLIKQTSAQRLNAEQEQQNLIRINRSMQNLEVARANSTTLSAFAENYESRNERQLADFNGRNQAHNVYKQGLVALSAYESGASAAAHIALSGFDTHDDHDARHYPRLMDLLQGIDGILQEASSRGLDNDIVVIMGSDFGRTNKYNNDLGKDHWPITSMMFMGNSNQVIRGNRVIGMTASDHKAIKIDPQTLEPDVDDTNPQSVRLTPAHIHRALRRLANIEVSTEAQQFALAGQDIDLFG